jgi:hypothetical protein
LRLDRETRDPTKAEDSRNQRNNQKRQSPTEHGGAPSYQSARSLFFACALRFS